jgi:hypothetical protein
MGKKKKKSTESQLISFDRFEEELRRELPTVQFPKLPETKQALGERIYTRIQDRIPSRAGKLTGMILELDKAKLDMIMEDEEAFDLCVEAASAQLDDWIRQGGIAC